MYSSSYCEFDIIESLELNYNLEQDVLERIFLENLNLDMKNGYYTMRDVKLFKAICCTNFDFKTYANDNDILISTLYKNVVRLREKIKIRFNSPNCGNGTKFEPHKVVSVLNKTIVSQE